MRKAYKGTLGNKVFYFDGKAVTIHTLKKRKDGCDGIQIHKTKF